VSDEEGEGAVSVIRTFLLRMLAAVLLAACGAALLLRETWGEGTIFAVAWAGLTASVMSLIGFRSLKQGLDCRPQALTRVLLLGLICRALVLAVSYFAVDLVVDGDWARRTLIVAAGFYGLALVVEVVSLNQFLKVRKAVSGTER